MIRLATDAMGTRFELVLCGEDEFFLRAVGEQAIEAIHEQHQRLNIFDPASLVSRVNLLAANQPVGVDRDLFDLLKLCQRVWRASGGAFDPAVGKLMERWGFRPGRGAEPGDSITASSAVSETPFAGVELDESALTVRFHRSDIALDFGAVGKGWAIDQAVSLMLEAGVTSALIHGGTSSVRAIGHPPEHKAWAIEIPAPSGVEPLLCMLKDAALGVSSPSGRTVDSGGRTHGHILDPQTGLPLSINCAACAVCPSAAEADAWSTALATGRVDVATMFSGIAGAYANAGAAEWRFARNQAACLTVQATNRPMRRSSE